MIQDKIFKLKGKVQHYAWGGTEYIPHWLGIENKDKQPYAEYWMGAHNSAPSALIINGKEQALNELIKEQPDKFIGAKTQNQFNELPYLFKILDVKDMLSIQVHPTKEAAEKGFEEEEEKGIALNAPERNYKDKNHKPEVMVALSDFWLLHGFLQEDKLLKVLQTVPEFKAFEKFFNNNNYKALYEHVMTMPQDAIDKLLISLVDREINRKKNNELTKQEPGWWVAKLYADKKPVTNIDRGIFSIYFLNIVKAEPGEAIFQSAGMLHAYLEGQNVELMANSDNVLRGGLTPKHIDVAELMKHTNFKSVKPNIMRGERLANNELNYPCPVKDFGISKIESDSNESLKAQSNSMEIIVVIYGEITIEGTNIISVAKGEAVAVLPAESYTITAKKQALAYKAFVP